MAESVAMLNFYPSFPAGQEQFNCGEFIFLMDQSGSMECPMNSEPYAPQRIHSARETLVLLLKSLPLGCYFNIYGFGSNFDTFFEESVEYTQQSMEEAVKIVNEMEASFGGTEILQPLKEIYQTAGRAEHPRQLFVFTDGEVGNTKQVINEVQKNSKTHRCFTFGIGEGASTSLIKGMARAGSGTFEFITGKDRMQPKVLRALKCSLQPTVKDISLTWTLPSGVEAIVLSKVPTAIFHGQRSIVYAQLKGKVENEADGEVCLQYKFKDEIIKNDLRFPLIVQNAERPTIHRLAAKSLISELELGTESPSEDVKKKILETSLQSGVVSSLTAYVAVNKDKKTRKTRVEGPPVRRDVPVSAFIKMGSKFPGGHRMMACASPLAMRNRMGRLRGGSSKSSAPPGACMPQASVLLECIDIKHMYDGGGGSSKSSAPPGACMPQASVLLECIDIKHMDDGVRTPALVRLINVQNADGSWNLTPQVSAVLGISETDIKTGNPDQKIEVSVWVTVLVMIWLHTTCVDQREEWELLEGKAISWVKAKAGSSLEEFVRAGNKLLKSSVDPKVFGL